MIIETTSMTETDFTEVKKVLATPKDIIIFGHRNPDGDAIGSSLGLMHYLNKFGHQVKVLYPSDYPANFGWMKGVDDAIIFDHDEALAARAIEKAEVAFFLDFNSLSRIDRMGELVNDVDCVKINIDHHLDPDYFADYLWWKHDASSTCEMVYKFIVKLGDEDKIDVTIGECLFTGLITDTGSFKFSTNPDVYSICGNLKKIGVDDRLIQQRLFQNLDEKHLRILGQALGHRMQIFPEYRTGLIYLTRKDFDQFNIQRGDTEGIVNYLLSLQDVRMAIFVTQQPNIVKLSLRSKGSFSVQEIATKYFNGGGHLNASGGYQHAGLGKTLDKIKSILPEYKDKLNDDTLFPE